MKRREFIGLLGAAAMAWSHTAQAQQAKVPRVGVLVIGDADVESFGNELRQGLRDLGYVEGRSIYLDIRSVEGRLDRLPELAAELVRLKVDVIVALFTPCALAAKQATSEIPIVILAGDPVGTGLVASLARPGGNITGLSQMAAEIGGKCVELIRDMLPSARRVAALCNAADPVFAKSFLGKVQRAGELTSMEIRPVMMVRDPDDLDAAFPAMVKEQADAVVVQGSLITPRVTDLALRHHLPAASTQRAFAELGGLISYYSDAPQLFRHSAAFVHKILQGNKPADIPVEQPTKFELVLNLRTAKALGIQIPGWLLSRADDVIE
jgi:ABC-type uncharacterized transport system substrate-binding protein